MLHRLVLFILLVVLVATATPTEERKFNSSDLEILRKTANDIAEFTAFDIIRKLYEINPEVAKQVLLELAPQNK
ncbi:unnamed protein product [Caenorhabditis auriculariae]|uniref:Uncharacterized protein n=1 Tax=Caenorhabditis auriculariae TaxID=2777116 RepID=A0A8S1GWM4_9PELO|nr:unnamed protein product [Caenorhabditis auriculariae]